ncbi:ImmA/IrrE family metallo-endopeptidase [Marinimicrobium sp. ABcell2]|uniref:ImmA/IrrE family metallo-endopeptidase n=1 Tax=Marinimicrobium sp. ABcell2 TaxID=3069751 RepID=UPI0027B7471E|nr:ImmA/IrrE family metallo-endopeptidase [Marinimicrobium sp. ABcell2]MDQ2076878.1 ImmA/IrrE family metallo-endopeptidase [Marinimicrobium sp. ABcell2]
MMKLIKSESEHQAALARLDELFDLDPAPGTAESDEIDVLALLIEAYEKEAFPIDLPSPVEAVKFRMEQQGLAQKDLVPYIGSKSKVSEVLSGKRALSLNMIRKLHEGLGIPYDVLMQNQVPIDLPREVDWCAFPLQEMRKRGLFGQINETYVNIKEYAEELVGGFFSKVPGASQSAPALLRSTAHATSNSKVDDPYALWAWKAETMFKAAQLHCGTYDQEVLTPIFFRDLATLSTETDGPIKAMQVLSAVGVRAVVVPKYEGTYLDGAAFLLADGQPVVALTLRYNRLDNFWFTLLHELAHVRLHLTEDNRWILDNLDDLGLDKMEEEANELAQNSLIPPELWTGVIADEHDVYNVAKEAKVHPAIVAGRIRHEKGDHARFTHVVKEPVKHYFSGN